MSSSYRVPKQTRATDAIISLKTYLGIQGGTEKGPLPTMSEIVEYSINPPRLLRISDSPLSILHDCRLPQVLLHDWYHGIALDYLEVSVLNLFQHWVKTYKKGTYDPRQFAQLVNDIYKYYNDTTLGLLLVFPGGSPFNSTDLKNRVQRGSVALIKELIPSFFEEKAEKFYEDGMNAIEFLFRTELTPNMEFAYLFSPDIAKYKDQELELRAQTLLDPYLPKFVDIFFLSDAMIESVSKHTTANEDQNDVSIDSWIDPEEESAEHPTLELHEFSVVCDKLNVLSLAPDWRNILQETINRKLNNSQWKKDLEVSLVSIIMKWLHVLILPWISYVMTKSEDINANWLNFIREKIKAEHVLYEKIYEIRIPDVFDIMNRYPLTTEALSDLRITATRRSCLKHLQDVSYSEIRDRLLNLGVAPTILLTQYVSCIQCLSIIDPSCETMVPIIQLVENYVQNDRDDIADGAAELIREQDAEIFQHEEEGPVYVFEKSELEYRKLDIAYDNTAILENLIRRTNDPIAMVVSLCNPVQNFVDAYCRQFGEALVKIKNYNADDEILKLELIKKNFPPETFSKCDVMLKDVDESKRVDKIIHENSNIDSTFHAMIVSKHYWPGMNDDDDYNEETAELKPLSKHKSCPEEYEAEFQKYKPSRKLEFMPNKGLVVLELEFESTGEKRTFHTTTEAAQVIQLFKTKDDRMTRTQIANKLNMLVSEVIVPLQYWYDQRIIQLENDGTFVLMEE